MTTRWLTPEEQRAWHAYLAASTLLEDALDRQLQQEAGMPHLYYAVLAVLSDAPDRRMRMTDLAEHAKITRSRLTYVVTRLEKDGAIRRENCQWDKRGSIAALTDEGLALLERLAPGHVEAVRKSVFDHLTPEQVGQFEEICSAIAAAIEGEEAQRNAPDDLPWRRRSCSSGQ
ncbi:MarR family winged helix-turn-helix transcriptional regulator [Streptomyces neyagawaensis]|uniref:MarR family winged helix-turn-helix transcriptional regulator n=1 Tax=Streptomyces neyagawaensis TaxID=42238 RepID=UPI0006E14DCA|nr:MarR family transcriptional regulator [Streptomyces neyagawaensis]MCL6738067.1 MarR family transcriptional regulator [Streptomyces neyagawaensis]MDE1688971.1 MarR family transcriptional regulator [Streptomyces neyagawaensis]